MSAWPSERLTSSGITPNSPIVKDGLIILPEILEKVSKIKSQKCASLEYVQNVEQRSWKLFTSIAY